jgi:hypothetical protein
MLCRRSDGGALESHPPGYRGHPHWLIDRSVNWQQRVNRAAEFSVEVKRRYTATDEMNLGTWALSRRQELRAFDSR